MSPWLAGRFGPSQRWWILLAALLLLPVFFLPVLPIWTMRLWAPQYPEGLQLVIYTNTIRGDLQKINTLNHYVGMKHITPQDFREFSYLPLALTLFGLLALLAALVNRRWLAIAGWLLFTAFSAYMFRDYALWLWHYGHDLDPRAAIKLPSFTPPVIGFSRMANFRVLSIPAIGTVLLGVAWAIGPALMAWDVWHARRPAKLANAVAVAVAVGVMLAFAGGRASAAPGSVEPDAAPNRVRVAAGAGVLQTALDSARPGDTLVLARGVHRGPVVIRKQLILRGEPGAVIDGGGQGTVITVACPGVGLDSLTIRGSGSNAMKVDAGVRIAACDGVSLRGLAIEDVLYGVNAERATGLLVDHCRVTGRVTPLDETGSGNGIHLWYSSGVRLVGNEVVHFLDAIYLSFADRVEVEGNLLRWNGRYGLHSMYSQRARLAGNVFTLNAAGCALMFSNQLDVERNDIVENRGPRTYGLLLRDCSDGRFRDNRLAANTIAVFMDGSNRNRFTGNLVENNGWGLLIFSSCANNVFAGNQFVQNDYPVALDMRRTSNRFSDGRQGNYWSENAAFDLDGDGVSDVPYSPVSAFAFLSRQYPDLTILSKSPAVAALGVAERVLPALHPSDALDSFPRTAREIRPEAAPAGLRREPSRASWAAATAFALLGAGGVAGIAGRSPRRERRASA